MSPSFDDLGLRSELRAAVAELGFVELTPIQAAALPPMLEGADVLGQAQTGSGKTAAFGLALLHRIEPRHGHPQALVLCPTRELAQQVADALRQLARRLSNTRITLLCGGRPMHPQLRALSRGAQVVVGTPGRIVDHLRRGSLDPAGLRVLVLDEADRLLDMGFADEVGEVMARCPQAPRPQTLLFSATWPDAIGALSTEALCEPVEVRVDRQVGEDLLQQRVLRCSPQQRAATVQRLLRHHRPAAALVFCETRLDCESLTQSLQDGGVVARAMHGAMEQRERDDVWVQLAHRSVPVVVATDVAARGLDLEALPLVIVAELSPDPTTHVHRIGRTARAGKGGLAVSLVAGSREEARLERIEEALDLRLPAHGPLPTDLPPFPPPPFRTLLVLSGRAQKLRKGDLLGALVKDGGLPPEAIGPITLRQTTCAVAIATRHVRAALRFLQRGRVKKSRLRVVLL